MQNVDNPASSRYAFLTEIPGEKLPIKVYRSYDGPVPAETCEHLCNRIIGCAKAGFCYPVQPMDVYGEVWLELVKAATDLPQLEQARASTYLHSVVDNLIRRHFARRVAPLRAEYRQLEGCLEKADNAAERKAQLEAPEGKDAGYAAYAEAAEAGNSAAGGTDHPLTAQQLAERLPSQDGSRTRQVEAIIFLEELLPRLPAHIKRAFLAYIAADGNLFEAAHLARIGKTRFYASWPLWLKQAREIAEASDIVRN